MKILTCCKHGLVRSVALADVLKLHFRPVDVVPIGLTSNTEETKEVLFNWADWIVVMERKYVERVPKKWETKVLVCDVGPDTYGNSHSPELIAKVWNWCRVMSTALGFTEHQESI